AKQLIREHGMPLAELEYCTAPLDWAVDGADEVDASLALIKGGGGCLLQEKIVDTAANSLVIVCDEAKISRQFGERWLRAGFVPMAWALVKRQIETRFGGRAVLRESAGKMGPVVTDNGNFLIDWQFDAQQKWEQVDRELHMMPGLVETGLFIGKASAVYVGKRRSRRCRDADESVCRRPEAVGAVAAGRVGPGAQLQTGVGVAYF
uniref:ribose-5-phosphate isomerase n=1 Tax=Macrostomum lignano TaxID=282301 RepID=A0A1I8F4X3_9PLAT